MEPLSVAELLNQKQCCGNGCANCPYQPRHTVGTTETQQAWIDFKQLHPAATYMEFLQSQPPVHSR